jgi:hypothetical protein
LGLDVPWQGACNTLLALETAHQIRGWHIRQVAIDGNQSVWLIFLQGSQKHFGSLLAASCDITGSTGSKELVELDPGYTVELNDQDA